MAYLPVALLVKRAIHAVFLADVTRTKPLSMHRPRSNTLESIRSGQKPHDILRDALRLWQLRNGHDCLVLAG